MADESTREILKQELDREAFLTRCRFGDLDELSKHDPWAEGPASEREIRFYMGGSGSALGRLYWELFGEAYQGDPDAHMRRKTAERAMREKGDSTR